MRLPPPLVVFLGLLLPSGAASQDVTFDLMLADEAGRRLGSVVQEGFSGLRSMPGHAAAATADVEAARREFWRTYPDHPDHAEAARAFQTSLFAKDLHYTMVRMFESDPLSPSRRSGVPAGFFASFAGSVDGGIPVGASLTFDRYVDAFAEAWEDETDGRVTNMLDPSLMIAAFRAAEGEYTDYVQERNLYEFDRAGVRPPQAGTLEGWLALEVARYDGDPGLDVDGSTDALGEVGRSLGEAFAASRLRRLYEAPKSFDGGRGPRLDDIAALGLSETGTEGFYPRRPLDAFFLMVLRDGTDRQWARAILARPFTWGWSAADVQLARADWALGAAAVDELIAQARAAGSRRIFDLERLARENPRGLIRLVWARHERVSDLRAAEELFQDHLSDYGGIEAVEARVPSLQVLEYDQIFDSTLLYDAVASEELGTDRRSYDASLLPAGAYHYQVNVAGQPVGESTHTIRAEGPSMYSVRSTSSFGAISTENTATFTESFEAVSSSTQATLPTGAITVEVRQEEGRIIGSATGPGVSDFEYEAIPGTVLGEGMAQLAAGTVPLTLESSLTIPYVDLQTGELAEFRLLVMEATSETVAAGTFDVLKARGSMGGNDYFFYFRQSAPHILVKQEVIGQPVTFELESFPGDGRD